MIDFSCVFLPHYIPSPNSNNQLPSRIEAGSDADKYFKRDTIKHISPIEKDITKELSGIIINKINFIIKDINERNGNNENEPESEKIKLTNPTVKCNEDNFVCETFKSVEIIVDDKKEIKEKKIKDEWVKKNLKKNLQAVYKNKTSEAPLSDTELSQELGVDQSTISKWKKVLGEKIHKQFYRDMPLNPESTLKDTGICKIIQEMTIEKFGLINEDGSFYEEEGSFAEFTENEMSKEHVAQGRPMEELVKTKIRRYLIALRNDAWKDLELKQISHYINIPYTQLIYFNNYYFLPWYKGWKKERAKEQLRIQIMNEGVWSADRDRKKGS